MSTKNRNFGQVENVTGDVKRAGSRAAFSPWMEALTRLGYGVRGFIYVVMGMLALSFAFGRSNGSVSPQSAIATIGRQPAGSFFLWVVLIGLAAYALWGVIRAVFDPLRKGNDLKGLAARIGFLLSAASYTVLALYTYSLISGSGSSALGGNGGGSTLAKAMSSPAGRLLVALIGVGVIVDGLYQITLGLNASFDKQYKTYAMTAEEIRAATQLGRFGTAARGVVFALVGGLIVLAAVQANPSQPIGIGPALSQLIAQPFGVWIVGIVAIGLIAFGLYSMLTALWFRSQRQRAR